MSDEKIKITQQEFDNRQVEIASITSELNRLRGLVKDTYQMSRIEDGLRRVQTVAQRTTGLEISG